MDGTTHSRTEKNKFKTLVIFKPLANRYGILSKTCCAKHCQIHAIIVLDKKCASSPPLPYPIALGAQHHLNPNTLGRPDLLWYIITFLIIFCREAWTTQIIFSFTFSKKNRGVGHFLVLNQTSHTLDLNLPHMIQCNTIWKNEKKEHIFHFQFLICLVFPGIPLVKIFKKYLDISNIVFTMNSSTDTKIVFCFF